MRALRLIPLVGLLIIAMALTSSCGSVGKTLEVTGESVVALGVQFDGVSRAMTAGCVTKSFTVKTCTDYRQFGEKFKPAYAAARTLWNTAAQYGDKDLAESAKYALIKLAADLAPFIAMIPGGK